MATALSRGSDEAYAAVREPVEGTILTVSRALAEEAEAQPDAELPELFSHARPPGRRGGRADARPARRPPQGGCRRRRWRRARRDRPRDRGAHLRRAAARGRRSRADRRRGDPPGGLSLPLLRGLRRHGRRPRRGRARARAWRRSATRSSSSATRRALKAHVHTDDPGAALRAGTALGVIERVEIANMHLQSAQREERLSHSRGRHGPDDGGRRGGRGRGQPAALREHGRDRHRRRRRDDEPIDGGATEAIERTNAPQVVVLANNDNVVLAARQAARLAKIPVQVVPSSSLQAGLGSLLAYESTADAETNAAAMEDAAAGVATGAVTIASRDVSVDGLQVESGAYLGLADGEPIAGGTELRHRRDRGRRPAPRRAARRSDFHHRRGGDRSSGPLLARVAERHPELELEVHPGGQPHYPLLLAAE